MLQRILKTNKSKNTLTEKSVLKELETAIKKAIEDGKQIHIKPMDIVKFTTCVFTEVMNLPVSSINYVSKMWNTVALTFNPDRRVENKVKRTPYENKESLLNA